MWSTVSFWLNCPAILLLLLWNGLEHGASLKSTPALTVHDPLVQIPIVIKLTQLSLSQVQLLKSQILIDPSRIGNPQLVLWAVLGAGGPQWYVPGAMDITLSRIKALWIRKQWLPHLWQRPSLQCYPGAHTQTLTSLKPSFKFIPTKNMASNGTYVSCYIL